MHGNKNPTQQSNNRRPTGNPNVRARGRTAQQQTPNPSRGGGVNRPLRNQNEQLNDLFSYFGAVGGPGIINFPRSPVSPAPAYHHVRAHSEHRAGTRGNLDFHVASGGTTSSRSVALHSWHHSAGKDTRKGDHRERPMQKVASQGRKIDGTQAQASRQPRPDHTRNPGVQVSTRHKSPSRYKSQKLTSGCENKQKDTAKGDHREKPNQRDASQGRKMDGTRARARSQSRPDHTRNPGVQLSTRHKSPSRYGSQNLTSGFKNKQNEIYYFNVFQPMARSFTTRAQSVQHLDEIPTTCKISEWNDYDLKDTATTTKLKLHRNEKKIDYVTITRLSALEPSEIIMKLAAPGSGLKEFLNENMIDFQLLEGFLKILNTSIGCMTYRQNLIHILKAVQNSKFLKEVLPSNISNFLSFTTEQDKKLSFIDHIIVLLNELVCISPSSAFEDVKIVEAYLKMTIDEMLRSGKSFPEEIQVKLMTLQSFLQHLQEKKQDGTLRSDNYIYMVGNRGHTEDTDFRKQSIFPTHKDIYLDQNPSMRPNIINGSYPDAKSYLDTHFRLLREDFIRPFRDGISQILSLKSKDLAKARFDDIRIYFDIRISFPVCTRTGIVHEIEFNTKNLIQVRWESSKRLLYGALVCLSKDNFENMFFATVADRNIKDLQKGIIILMFTEESRQKLAQHTIEDNFLMVEATAYFEAYRHVLEGLKEMADSEIPFQNYIVHCNKELYTPLYLQQKSAGYSLESIIATKGSNKKIQNRVSACTFDVLKLNTWPAKEELDLDRSQFKALQMALTCELSIIQGPPGAGKTYVGLKIVHALLTNSQFWKQGNSPILIICYTNHALDQFLEGILKYRKCNIVRVGSRSNSEILQKCALSNIRNQKHRSALPGHMRAMHAELSGERQKIQDELMKISSYLQNVTKGILHENILQKFIPPHQFTSLMSQKIPVSSVIKEWLGISAIQQETPENPEDLKFWEQENISEESVGFDDFTSCEEAQEDDLISVNDEAELAEAERMIDEDDNIKKQIKMARDRAAKDGKDILAYIPDEKGIGDDINNEGESGWQIPNDVKKKWEKLIKRELKKSHNKDEQGFYAITDLWKLSVLQRWEIYRWWRSKYLTDIRLQIFDLENQYQILINRLAELKIEEDLLILQEADIIGMTTTGAAKFRRILQNIRPKIIVVEEAAEVLEAHIITALSSGCQQLVLIGDHQQLRPSTTVYELAKNFNLEVSMFERLIRMDIPYVRLDYQHRMRPEIARLLTPHIYDKLENHESVLNFHNIKGVCDNVFFVDHNQLEEHILEGKSHQNSHEAAFVRSLCLYFIHQGYNPSEITILTTYSGQLHCLQKKMPKSMFEGVRVCVVDKYQGEENEIIILSLVRSNLHGQVGFLQIPNRVCVALSRAKKGLFCIGNMQLLSKVPLWSKIHEVLKANGQIGKELKLQCQNHLNTITYVSTSDDFDNVPEGGCKIPCEYRLDCGHVCTLLCHPYDTDHKAFKCMKPCPKVLCENGHKCTKRCNELCGKCEMPVPKIIPTCGHSQKVPCSMSPDKIFCKEPCTKILSCGHLCVRSCGQVCTHNCSEKIPVELECGHTSTILCYLKSESEMTGCKLQCNVQCQENLSCGHRCTGKCSICLDRAHHADCAKQCNNILFCSHQCEEKCSKDCFCILACTKKCFHKKCPVKCSEPCSPCTEPCGWKCKHASCTKLCCELCDREPCDEPCWKTLKCGHSCIGLCGEPCPKKCRKCDRDAVTELFFGKEADKQARFVQLMDCPHFFEVTKFTNWMNQEEENQVIRLKSCPKCSTTIRQNLRFNTLIKQTHSDIEIIKERIVGIWLNQLEVFISENEDLLKHFPVASQLVRQMQDNQFTLRTLMLVSEKIQFCQKLAVIKEKLLRAPQLQCIVDKQINNLYHKAKNAKNKHDILEECYELLFILAVEVEILLVEEKLPKFQVQNVRDLIEELKAKNPNIHVTVDKVMSELRKIPVQMQLISLIDNKKSVLNTEVLMQDHWHKCSSGHIYTGRKDEETMLSCPQCCDIDEEEEEEDDDDVGEEDDDDDVEEEEEEDDDDDDIEEEEDEKDNNHIDNDQY